MTRPDVPNPAVRRLTLYLRQLEQLLEEGADRVSSSQLAQSLHITAAQVRKDLGYFGAFGRPGVGYRTAPLIDALRHILGTDKPRNVIVVGAGDLGRALLRYKGFKRKGFNFVAAFDIAPGKVHRSAGGVEVHHLRELPRIARRHGVKLAVLAVPPEAAQECTDLLCGAGVRGILNFAPTTLTTPEDVAVGPVDLAGHLEQLSYLLGPSR